MTTTYNQTNTSATFDVGCSGYSAGQTTGARQATVDATLGDTEFSAEPNHEATEACAAFDCGPAPGLASWGTGDYVVNINHSTMDAGTQLTAVYVCDYNGSTYQEVCNNSSPGHTRGATGTIQVTCTRGTEYIPQSQANSRPFIVLVYNTNEQHGGHAAGITPDQTIVAPFTVGTDKDVPVSVETATGSVQAPATAVLCLVAAITATITLNAPTIEIVNGPAAVEATASVVSPTPESLVAPAAVSATAALQTPTAEARASPAAVTATGAAVAPSLAISTTVEPSAISATGSAVAPVPEARASPAAVEATSSVRGNITLDLLSTVQVPSSLTGSVQQPSVQTTGDKTVPVSAVTATGSIPGGTPDVRQSPAAIEATGTAIAPAAEVIQPASAQTAQGSVQTPTPEIRLGPSAVEATGAAVQPTVQAGGDKTVPVSVVTATGSIPGAMPEIRQSPAAQAATATAIAPAADVVHPASAQTAQGSLGTPTPEVRQSPAAVEATGAVQTPTVDIAGEQAGTAAAGCISLAEDALCKTLADSAAFRTLVSAADRAEALESIYTDGLPKPADNADAHTLAELQAYRPYAVIFTAEQDGLIKQVEAAGDRHYFEESGRLTLRLIRDCPDDYDDQPSSLANRDWRTIVGNIKTELRELAAAANQADYLAIERITTSRGPYWGHPKVIETQGCWQGIDLLIQW